MAAGQGTLSLITNENGGIKDDCVITNAADHGPYLYVVSNAGCDKKDIAHFQKHLDMFRVRGGDVSMELLLGRGLLALQGPLASKVLQGLANGDAEKTKIAQLRFMHGCTMPLASIPNCRVTRCGYTGEDGYEISVESNHTQKLALELLKSPEVKLAGLAARDALRLESGLCLYGNDIDENTSPVEASLRWTIGKRRKTEGGFLGASTILRQLKDGVGRHRVGLTIAKGGAPARAGAEIYDETGKLRIGKVTSGMPSPYTGKYIAMAYIESPHHKVNTNIKVSVRNRMQDAVVTKMPFVPHHYFK